MRITLICIPTLDEGGLLSSISMHFGKTPYFTFIKLEKGEIKEINVIKSAGKHKEGSKTPTEIILDLEVDVIICGGLGEKAISILHESGVEVFSGASGKVRDVINEWKVGFLPIADENFCKNGCKES
jgi:predicted Fe-Mo cluster-binding NifX family protein